MIEGKKATMRRQDAKRMWAAVQEVTEFFIDDTLSRSKNLRRHHARVSETQASLRAAVDEAGWSAFLRVEKAMNNRMAKEVRLVFNRMLAVFAYATLPPRGSRR